MKSLTIIGFIFLLLLNCDSENIPLQAIQSRQLTISETSDSVLYSLSIVSDTFMINDTLRATFLLLNNARTTRDFTFSYFQQVSWTVRTLNDSVIMYQPHYLSPAVTEFSLNPSESKVYHIKQKVQHDNPREVILPGLYNLSVFLRHMNSPMLTLKIYLK